MRRLTHLLIVLSLAASHGAAQVQNVNVSATGSLFRDERPFGKYLVEICGISGEVRILRCVRTPLPPAPVEGNPPNRDAIAQLVPQNISIKLDCDPAAQAPCTPQYPLIAGSDFFVTATSDAGGTVTQRVLSGLVTPVGGSGTIHYRANAPGVVVIRATAVSFNLFAEAAPVDLILQVVADPKKTGPGCPVLPPVNGTQSMFLDAPTIVSLLGNPTPFVLSAQGPNTIAAYATRLPLTPNERLILESFQGQIAALAGRTAASLGISPAAKPFSVELTIPHAAAMGDLATRANSLNFSQFAVQDIGSDRIRVTAAAGTPDCDPWKAFLSGIRRTAWQLISEPMSTKLFYLSSADVATAFNTTSSSAPTTPVSTAPANPSTTPAPASTAAGSGATITVSQPLGTNVQITSDSTPCVIAGLASGNTSPCGSAPALAVTAPPVNATPTTPPANAPLGMQSLAVNAGNGTQNPPDLLVYSDTNPGDDAQVQERNRVLAQLDLPRPEMIINAWVTQDSSSNPQAIGAFTNLVKGMVSQYDDEFSQVVLRGWESVKTQSAAPGYFNESYRSYIEDRSVVDTYKKPAPDASPQELAQAFLNNSQAVLVDPFGSMSRTALGLCGRNRYCLGYDHLFHPLKPTLTDLLLTIIAAQNPVTAADTAILNVEGPALPALAGVCGGDPSFRPRCQSIRRSLPIDPLPSLPPTDNTCVARDYRGILGSLMAGPAPEPRVHLQCFKEAADLLLRTLPEGAPPPSPAGLLRAAVAGFLFNYKISQQYPHEFSSYDLSHSADALNSALNPIIDAFNRDIWAYQQFVRADMQYRVEQLNNATDGRCCIKRLFGLDKPSFFNDGLVTVRTISGQWTYANTTTQSFLNVSTAPELSNLLNSLTAANSGTAGSGSALGTVLSATPLGKTTALATALSNYQTTYAQIGRSLQVSAIPRSLLTAASAEIAVTLNADESANGPLYTGGGANDPASNTSRVASHDTATRVRVESVKLFEISSLTAIVERSRSRFPLLPPFIEIPYIGTLAGIPLPPAKEYHASTAILSAYVVPTAADLANGLRFASDLIVDGLNPGPCSYFPGAAGPDVPNACLFRRALSMHDFGSHSIGSFNREMTRCLSDQTSSTYCSSVTLDNVPNVY